MASIENGREEGHADDSPLFPYETLERISWDEKKSSFRDGVSPKNPGKNLTYRPLELGDFDKGYMELLSELTRIGEVSREDFSRRFELMRSSQNTYYVTVIEDTSTGSIIGAASLIIEQKFIHSCGCRGRIEDVIVSDQYRGKQLGKLLVESLTLLGKALGCYKMSLECKEENVKFYQSFGYEPDGQLFMIQRFKD